MEGKVMFHWSNILYCHCSSQKLFGYSSLGISKMQHTTVHEKRQVPSILLQHAWNFGLVTCWLSRQNLESMGIVFWEISLVCKSILGINTSDLALLPTIIMALKKWSHNCCKINLVPLHNPSAVEMFLSSKLRYSCFNPSDSMSCSSDCFNFSLMKEQKRSIIFKN